MVIDNYIKSVENFLFNYYHILLGNQYEKKMLIPFVNKYIDVRYYGNSVYSGNDSFLEKLNKELKCVAKDMIKQNNSIEEKVKKIFTLFGYVLYIDDCSEYSSLNDLLQMISNDLNLEETVFLSLKGLVLNFVDTRKSFLTLFFDKEFKIVTKRVARNLKKADLKQYCKFSPIYSKWAIEKAYDSGTVLENRQFLLYLLLSGKILDNSLNLNFRDNYLVDFPDSLFSKEKKINKYVRLLDNKLVKSRIHLRIDYQTYLAYSSGVNSLINMGFNVSVVLDEFYDENLKILDIFSYVFVYQKYEYYDIIIENKDGINASIVSL